MKIIIIVSFLLTSFSVLAADSARQSCIKDAQTVKNSDLATCEKKTNNERSSCNDRAQQDYLQALKRCDVKYIL